MNKETLALIMKKAATDLEYRQRLVKMPRAVLMQEGFLVPADKNVVVLESSDDLFYVVLPPPVSSSPAPSTDFSLRIEGDVVHLQGRLDSLAVEKIRSQLLEWQKNLTLDMEMLIYISSAGLGLLLMLQKRLQEQGLTLQLTHLQAPVRNVFVLSGFDSIFNL